MTDPNRETSALVIPTNFLLGGAGAGALLALIVALTQPSFTVVGWAGIAIAVLSLLAWAFMAPEQLRALLRGRAFTFGGTAFVVTLIFFVALVLLYVLIRQQNWRRDFSQSEIFSLSEPARALVTTLTADPNTPPIRILGFLGAGQAGERDRARVLLDDFQATSQGRITYEFIDPDRDPLILQNYEAQPGNYVVVPLGADGQPELDRKEIVAAADQRLIAQALVRVSALGDFRAYFITTTDGPSINDSGPGGAQVAAEQLRTGFKWTVEEVSLVELPAKLQNSGDGSVVILAGGSEALPDEAVQPLIDHLEAGGSLILYAGFNTQGGEALATASNLSDYLFENFGLRIRNDIVMDPFSIAQGRFQVVGREWNASSFITEPYTDQQLLVMEPTHSIELAATPPQDVTLLELARSVPDTYSKSGLNFSDPNMTTQTLAAAAEDPVGPFVLAASAENTRTGARVVVFGSDSPLFNQYAQLQVAGVVNTQMTLYSAFWASNFDAFAANIPTLPVQDRPQDQPLFASEQTLRTISFVSVIGLPFGLLALGIFMAWMRRERSPIR